MSRVLSRLRPEIPDGEDLRLRQSLFDDKLGPEENITERDLPNWEVTFYTKQ